MKQTSHWTKWNQMQMLLYNQPKVSLLEEQFHGLDLVIHRTTLLKDMITAFSDPTILKVTIFLKLLMHVVL